MDDFLAWVVIMAPTLFAIGLEVVEEEQRKGWTWKWRIGVIGFGVLLSALTGFQIHRADRIATRDRETAIRETSEKVSASVSASVSDSVTKSVTKAVGDQYADTINRLNTQIGNLQGLLATQGKDVKDIKSSKLITGKEPVKVEISNPGMVSGGGPQGASMPQIHVSSLPTTPTPQFGKFARQVILTTDRRMDGGRVRVICKGVIKRGDAFLSGTSGVMGGGALVDDHTYDSGAENPETCAHPVGLRARKIRSIVILTGISLWLV
jgi:hypothetical protein